MIIDMVEASEGQDALAGSMEGAATLSRLIAKVASAVDTDVVLLDFRNVDVSTASFLREAVLGFRDYCRRSRPNLYPVVANAKRADIEELEVLLGSDALVVCDLDAAGRPVNARVVGRLEEKQRDTLAAVLQARQVDASTLAGQADRNSRKMSPTAWNNRLAALAAKGILIESRRGRGKVYRPVVEELQNVGG